MGAVVTSNTSCVSVVFNGYGQSQGMSKGTWPKREIARVILTDEFVEVVIVNGTHWVLKTPSDSYETAMDVTSIDGFAPSNLDELYTALSALV